MQFINGPTRGRGAIPDNASSTQQQQQLQEYLDQAENDLQNDNIDGAISALQNAEQIANQIGDTQVANTISQAIQILNNIKPQLYNAISIIQQEQNNSSYTQNDLQSIQNAINELNNVKNSVDTNPFTTPLSSYVNNLLSTAQKIESNIQSYLQQQQQQQQSSSEQNTQQQQSQQEQQQSSSTQQEQNYYTPFYFTPFSAPTQSTQPQVSIDTEALTINLQNALQSGNLNEALQILNQLESSTNNTAEINQAIDTINQVKNLLQELNTALIQGQNPQFVVSQFSALADTNNPYLNGLSTYINNIVSGFSPNNSSQEVQVQYNPTVANYLMNNDYADAIAAAPQYAPYIVALAQEQGSTFTMKMNGLLESFYYYAAKAYEALKNGDRNAAIQYKEKAKYYQNIINALSTITGQNFTQNATYDAAVNALNAVINVVGDAAIAAAPSILSSGTETQRAQIQLL
ncbi:MAG: hypothetical protein QXV57_09220 [Thermoproteota archaeon]